MIAFMVVTKGNDDSLKFGGLFGNVEDALAKAAEDKDVVVIVQLPDIDGFTLQ